MAAAACEISQKLSESTSKNRIREGFEFAAMLGWSCMAFSLCSGFSWIRISSVVLLRNFDDISRYALIL